MCIFHFKYLYFWNYVTEQCYCLNLIIYCQLNLYKIKFTLTTVRLITCKKVHFTECIKLRVIITFNNIFNSANWYFELSVHFLYLYTFISVKESLNQLLCWFQVTDSKRYILAQHSDVTGKGRFSFSTEHQDIFEICFKSRVNARK